MRTLNQIPEVRSTRKVLSRTGTSFKGIAGKGKPHCNPETSQRKVMDVKITFLRCFTKLTKGEWNDMLKDVKSLVMFPRLQN